MRKKILVVGDKICGKTALIQAFTANTFSEMYNPTIFDNYASSLMIKRKEMELLIWDTTLLNNHHFHPLKYPEVDVVLICFSIDSPNSFDNVHERWVFEIKHILPDVPVVLVGNKKDLRHNKRIISKLRRSAQEPVGEREGYVLAEKIGAAYYVECSAKTMEGVSQVFETATKAAMKVDKRQVLCCVVK